MESAALAPGLLLLRSWRGRTEWAERTQGSAQPLTSDRLKLLFILCQFILARPVVLYATPCPSLSDQVIREHRLCTAINIFFLNSFMSMMKVEIEKSKEVTVWKQLRTLA